jgi:zinc transport system substrate-binding protein
MNRNTTLIVSVVALIVVIAFGVSMYNQGSQPPANSETLKVVATFYPLYDFASNVGGDKATVTILVPETIDVHEFEPTPSSIQLVSGADIIVYNGAQLETWINQIIQASGNTDIIQVNCSEGINLIPVSQEFQQTGRTVDPHFWLDPILVKQIVENIREGFVEADPANAQYFNNNAQSYQGELDALNQAAAIATEGTETRYFVTFHEAFAYFAKRYNLTQIPIAGPFQEEPTPSDIQKVIQAVNQYHLRYIGYESLESPDLPQFIASETNATLILMNPIEGLTEEEKASGDTYMSLMYMNIQVFEKVLNDVG